MATTIGVDRESGAPAPAVPPKVDRRRVLLLLGTFTFTATITFQVGLSRQGRLWSDSDNGRGVHMAGDPVPLAFVYGNATPIVASLAVVVLLLLSRNPFSSNQRINWYALLVGMHLFLLCLIGAYAVSCFRLWISTCVFAYVVVVLLCIAIQFPVFLCKPVESSLGSSVQRSPQECPEQQNLMTGQGSDHAYQTIERSRKHILLLAVLAATVTYQAGLSPLDGSWHGEGTDTSGDDDRILHDKRRYLVFFCFNASAFLVSLAIPVMLLLGDVFSTKGTKYPCALQAAVAVDLFCLIGAYVAVDWLSLIGAYAAKGIWQLFDPAYFTLLLVLVAINVVVFLLQVLLGWGIWRQALREKMEQCLPDWIKKLFGLSTDGHAEEEEEEEGDDEEEEGEGEEEDDDEGAVAMELKLEEWRKLLLLLAILAAILAYHAITSPPPNNLINYRRMAFSYCKATLFITSISIIAMLTNRKLPVARGVRWHAMRVCVILEVVGLTGAFAARGYWKISAIDILVLVLAVLLCITFHIALSIPGTPRGLVQSFLSNLRSPPAISPGPDPLLDDTEHDFEVGLTGGTNEEPLAVEIASPILGGALTLIVAVPVISIVAVEVKLLVGIIIASIGVSLWRRSLARLLRALASALQRRQGTTPSTGPSSTLPEHGLCKLMHTLCSETWMWIIILVIWVPSLRHNLKLKFKLSRIFAVFGVLVDSTPTRNTSTATAASTTTTATVDAPSTATSTSTVAGSGAPITAAASGTSMGRGVRPLLELRPTSTRNRRSNSRLFGPDWVN